MPHTKFQIIWVRTVGGVGFCNSIFHTFFHSGVTSQEAMTKLFTQQDLYSPYLDIPIVELAKIELTDPLSQNVMMS